MVKLIYSIIIGAGLLACSSVTTLSVHPASAKMTPELSSNARIDSLIAPYRDSMNREMNVVVGKATVNFIAERPNSNMGNWFADAVFANQTRNVRLAQPTFCLFNVGGIRSSINKGDITIGDVFKVMPFDNEIVWVQLPVSALSDIEAYIKKSGGEPLSNATISNGKLSINGMRDTTTHFWIITSDYLMNGGDKMYFFEKKTQTVLTGKLLRNALLEEVKLQGILINPTDKRIY
jgi:2',3'-cyclic-nucleotide 2'-phosphodiesterase (5'-nucleotidase family)